MTRLRFERDLTRAMNGYDYCVIGGGIVGLATATEIRKRHPKARIVLFEKERALASHQTGHNSGVIHAGVYYQPGSLKARLCRAGAERTKAFCTERNIPFEVCGKLIVATNDIELQRMEDLKIRARDNGLAFETLDRSRLAEIEPNISGVGAILVPSTGIVDYARIARAMAEELADDGVDLRLGQRIVGIAEGGTEVEVATADGEKVRAGRLIVCGGLQSDRLAKMAGMKVDYRIVPFRGEYYTLPASRSDIVNHLIYPVPDPELPFLGIHLTRMIDGRVTVGPNAVLGFSREGYPRLSLDLRDVAETVGFPGFWKMARANLRSGAEEFRNSFSRRHYLEQCRKYCPSLTLADLTVSGAGIRAQAMLSDGTLVHDFLFLQSERMLHVCNAPSPAATSAMPIAELIVDRLEDDQSGEGTAKGGNALS